MAIDRRGLAAAHAVRVSGVLPQAPLTVGNGELCFTVDVTGLQTWPDRYPAGDGTPLSTLSNWGWPVLPGGEDYDVAHCVRQYPTRRGSVPYADLSRELGGPDAAQITAEEAWLHGNPHRLDLLRMGFAVPAAPGWQAPDLAQVAAFVQQTDLWTRVITSAFRLQRAIDAGLRPRPFPGQAASLLPGLLAATRQGHSEITQRDGNGIRWTCSGGPASGPCGSVPLLP